MTMTLNSSLLGEMLAQRVIEARAALSAAKKADEEAAAAFAAAAEIFGGVIVTKNGEKVQVVDTRRRTVDEDALRVVITDSQWRRVSTRKADLAKLDQAVTDGWLPGEAAGAITTTASRHVKVTIPKLK